jgi:hypothetical protein
VGRLFGRSEEVLVPGRLPAARRSWTGDEARVLLSHIFHIVLLFERDAGIGQ